MGSHAGWLDLGAQAVRRLPPRTARVLIMLDLILAGLVPPWTYFFFSRWKGRVLGPREFFSLYARGFRFAWEHLVHMLRGAETGALFVDWSAPPARRTLGVERPDWPTKGTCGTCMKCCSTTWLPEGKRATCPFLGAKGCTIYGGLYWDYFNCGRYPAIPEGVSYYECPRFVGVFEPRPRLPVVAASGSAPALAAAPSPH
jgi:hypothetical protein